MSNITTKNCDHKTCNKLYSHDSNNWWWAYRKNQILIFGMFHTSLQLSETEHLGFDLNKDVNVVLHFCGQEHLMSWVNENVGRIIESQQKETQKVCAVSNPVL
jgi:Leu/Phe-tRNA-protein transferase